MASRERGSITRTALAHLAALSRRLATEHDVRVALEDLLRAAAALIGAERAFFLMKRHGALTCEAESPASARIHPHTEPGLSGTVLGKVLDTGEAVLSSDVAGDERFRSRLSVRRLGLRSVLAVPFPSRAGATGVLYLDSRASRTVFGRPELELLALFAAQAALALDNALLSREVLGSDTAATGGPASDAAAPAMDRTGRGAFVPQAPSQEEDPVSAIIGTSPAIRRVHELVRRAGPTDLPVLIVGESGTGKELVARALHLSSGRHAAPFVAENCAAIAESLIESELFGAVRGAYTGAEKEREGLFRAAAGGTLFLDEIGEMPMALQARLLRALQAGEIRPVGASRPLRVDVRILAATNRDPAHALESGSLRLDLYYRLSAVTIVIPPLRDRRRDIPLLAAHFLRRFTAARGIPPRRFSAAAARLLTEHDWPGNVRELENECERASALSRAEILEPWDLSARLRPDSAGEPAARIPAERSMIEAALLATGGRKLDAARQIGWSRQKLHRRMVRLGMPLAFGRPAE